VARPTTGQVNQQQQLLVVAWSAGSQEPHERHLQSKKVRTPRDIDKGQHHGRRFLGKECCGGGAKVVDLKLYKFALTLDFTPTMLTATADDTEILDSRCTSNFLSATPPWTSKQAAHIPLSVNTPNGTSIQSSHTCDLLLTDLPPQERKAHLLPGLVHNSLISVRQLCDNG
jgi:hypothetical protein